ncbi:MAG: hypothetical protein COT24_01550 [Candidatus Kerfeldbacteria bacterium CG08_land_8_20_14_0_20_40_16]|uniref:Uncharacterized protein n=1 Tax=Candidatus Kerfeldbacteria bacterium CG08_land_8_20_14_0_20_40_16 TaxID=2014244 RepID=A0A2H0YWC8_9BACT|nr:MAG: hypothetical protein COT24_01550 [Candidatus Kerfeldbacteria bacterium CG08_land_8_20_14_0_20_40_16]
MKFEIRNNIVRLSSRRNLNSNVLNSKQLFKGKVWKIRIYNFGFVVLIVINNQMNFNIVVK